MKTQVVVIDGGFQASGEALVKHIIEVYGTTYVDVGFVRDLNPSGQHQLGDVTPHRTGSRATRND